MKKFLSAMSGCSKRKTHQRRQLKSKPSGKWRRLALELNKLLGQDSNLQPAGYKCPGISPGLGLSLHLPHRSGVKVSGAREALLDGFLNL